MKIPKESLEDWLISHPKPEAPQPPPVRSLRPTGSVELLKPLTPPEVDENKATAADGSRRGVLQKFSWVHQSLLVGGLAMAAFILSSIFIAITESQVEQALTQPDRPAGAPAVQTPFADEPVLPAGVEAEISTDTDEPDVLSVRVRRSTARPRPVLADYRPRRFNRRMVMSPFVPTTLVIYARNGVIRTRVEVTKKQREA